MRVASQIGLQFLQTGVHSMVGLLFPPECPLCHIPLPGAEAFCAACRPQLVSSYYRCQKCATPLPTVVPNQDCLRCRGKRWAFHSVITLGPYRDRLQEVAIAMKKPPAESLRRAVGRLLSEQILLAHPVWGHPSPVIVPVPYHWTHAFQGASDTAGVLSQTIARQTGLIAKSGIVRRIKKTSKQGMLAWTERVKNVRGAFAIRKAQAVKGRHVFIVDDVLTSGATSAEIARVLVRAGAARVDVVVAARGTGVKSTGTSPTRSEPRPMPAP